MNKHRRARYNKIFSCEDGNPAYVHYELIVFIFLHGVHVMSRQWVSVVCSKFTELRINLHLKIPFSSTKILQPAKNNKKKVKWLMVNGLEDVNIQLLVDIIRYDQTFNTVRYLKKKKLDRLSDDRRNRLAHLHNNASCCRIISSNTRPTWHTCSRNKVATFYCSHHRVIFMVPLVYHLFEPYQWHFAEKRFVTDIAVIIVA